MNHSLDPNPSAFWPTHPLSQIAIVIILISAFCATGLQPAGTNDRIFFPAAGILVARLAPLDGLVNVAIIYGIFAILRAVLYVAPLRRAVKEASRLGLSERWGDKVPGLNIDENIRNADQVWIPKPSARLEDVQPASDPNHPARPLAPAPSAPASKAPPRQDHLAETSKPAESRRNDTVVGHHNETLIIVGVVVIIIAIAVGIAIHRFVNFT